MKKSQIEVSSDKRFRFGSNWKSFLKLFDEKRLTEAEESLKKMLNVSDLKEKRFLDIGSGSGLFSLAARRLGGTIHSFDYDLQSVECTQKLKHHYFPEDLRWVVEQGSVLDRTYLSQLGQFDIVYSWGVLHHTGAMWKALENVVPLVGKNGLLFIAIYNDEDLASILWNKVKRIYNGSVIGSLGVKAVLYPWYMVRSVMVGLIKYHHPLGHFIEYRKKRGMSIMHDWMDWLGGYPYEVAKPEELLVFYRKKGFELVDMKSTNRLGCNELLFVRKTECVDLPVLF